MDEAKSVKEVSRHFPGKVDQRAAQTPVSSTVGREESGPGLEALEGLVVVEVHLSIALAKNPHGADRDGCCPELENVRDQVAVVVELAAAVQVAGPSPHFPVDAFVHATHLGGNAGEQSEPMAFDALLEAEALRQPRSRPSVVELQPL
jgi:hypothetical protein